MSIFSSAHAHPFHAGETLSSVETPLSAGWALTGIAIALMLGIIHARSLTRSFGGAHSSATSRLTKSRRFSKHALKRAFKLGFITTAHRTALVFSFGGLLFIANQYWIPVQLYPVISLLSGIAICSIGFWLLDNQMNPSTQPSVQSAKASLAVYPSTLVLLLSAIALHKIAYGLLLLLMFSLGLAATLTAAELICADTTLKWLPRSKPIKKPIERLLRKMPLVSALVCIALGLGFAVGAIA